MVEYVANYIMMDESILDLDRSGAMWEGVKQLLLYNLKAPRFTLLNTSSIADDEFGACSPAPDFYKSSVIYRFVTLCSEEKQRMLIDQVIGAVTSPIGKNSTYILTIEISVSFIGI